MRRLQNVIITLYALLFLSMCGAAYAQTGILTTARTSPNWRTAGIPGGLPDGSWSQCGSSISAYSGDASRINNALAACSLNQYVSLGPGTFTISTGIQFPRNLVGHLALRGQGANSTFINYQSGVNCNGASAAICISSSDGTYPGMVGPTTVNWTGGYAQGTTQLTLSSVAGVVVNQTLLVLNQCDTGYSTNSCTGSAIDNHGYFICSAPYADTPPPTVGCDLPSPFGSPDGSTWRDNAWQMETVQVTAINAGGCGATCVTISQPLEHPNWSSGQSPQAVIIQPVQLDGIENLALDGTNAGTTDACIGGQNTWEIFVSGVKCSNSYSRGIYSLDGFHWLIQNNYIVQANIAGQYSDGMGIRISWGGDDLIQNNIVQKWKVSFVNDGPSPSDVLGYNYFINQQQLGFPSNGDFMWGGTFQHATGDDFQLFEGNAMNQSQDDNIHGGHVNQTRIRNFFWGYEQCANGQCGSFTAKTTSQTAIISSSTSRYGANIANVLGTPGFTNIYLNSQPFGSNQSYQLGGGNAGATTPSAPSGLPNDPLVISTGMRWDNWDAATPGIVCDNSQVPTSAPTYPNPVPSLGCGGGPLPASFYLTSKPAWFGSVPFPPIGPEVTGGNVGQCNGSLNVAGRYNGLAAVNSSDCAGSGSSTAWGGHVNAIPAWQCFRSMGGTPDGTGPVLPFDANACYPTGTSSASTPTFSPSSGSPPQTITISTISAGAFICWNTTGGPVTDGVSGCTVGTKYTTPVSVAVSTTLYAVAGGPTYNDSPVGTATYTSAGTPTFTITPSSQDFGSELVGTGSAVHVLTLTNPGMASLIINLPFSPGNSDFMIVSNDVASRCGGVIAPASPAQPCSSATISVQFTPSVGGLETTTIPFTDNASGSPHSVTLTGTGLTGGAVMSPSNLTIMVQ